MLFVGHETARKNTPKSKRVPLFVGILAAMSLLVGSAYLQAPVHAETVEAVISSGPSTGIISAEIQSVAEIGANHDGKYRITYRVLGATSVSLYIDGSHQQTVTGVDPDSWRTMLFDIAFTQFGAHSVHITATNGDPADDISSSATIQYKESNAVEPTSPTPAPGTPEAPATSSDSTSGSPLSPQTTRPSTIVFTVERGTGALTDSPVIPKRPTFSGTAPFGTQITVTVFSDPVVCRTTALKDRTWSCTLESDLPAGNHSVYIEAKQPGFMAQSFGPYAVSVGEQDPEAPVTPTPEQPAQETPTPTPPVSETKSSFVLWPWLLGAALLVMSIGLIVAKKRSNKRNKKSRF